MRFRKKPACIYYQSEQIMIERTGAEVSGSWVRSKRGGEISRRHSTFRSATSVARTICRCTIIGSLKRGDLTRFDIYNKPTDDKVRGEWNRQFRSLPKCPVLKSRYWNNEYDNETGRKECGSCPRRLLYEKQNEETMVLTRLEDKDF